MVFQTVIGGYRSLELVSWANGTPEQLAAMLDAHYAGRINIANYWSVGDSRTVAIDAIASNDSTGAMAAQTAQLVLMNAGGKTLVNAEHGVNTCAFIVGFKNCLSSQGKLHTSSSGKYSNWAVRTFLNNSLYLALPSEIQTLFKLFVNKATEYKNSSSSSLVETEELLALPAGIEITGSTPAGAQAGEGSQFQYYETAANRIKTVGGSAGSYWTRSAKAYEGAAYMSSDGTLHSASQPLNSSYGLSPFGVI